MAFVDCKSSQSMDTEICVASLLCLLLWVAKLETSHILQSNAIVY